MGEIMTLLGGRLASSLICKTFLIQYTVELAVSSANIQISKQLRNSKSNFVSEKSGLLIIR
jgi:hypothetical protein